MKVFITFLLILQAFHTGNSFHFDLSNSKQIQRCFVEDIEDSVTFKASYKVRNKEENSDSFHPGAVYIRVIDPNGQDMLQRQYKDQGTFAFYSGTDGTYEICFIKVPTETQIATRVYLHYEFVHQETPNSQMELDDNEMKENSTESESEMERMLIRVEETYDYIWRMYLKFKKREKHFRELSKTTNSRIVWWAIFQVVVLFLTGAWQMRHLTKFFILKKIV